MSSRLRESIESAVSRRGLAFLPFLPAGYPDRAGFAAALRAVTDAGADCVEIGFPFSDPIADGPTIQAAFAHALRDGVKVADVFAAVASARQTVQTPLVAMVSHSIVFRQGVERFCGEAKSAGFDGILIPDLPPPEAQATCEVVRSHGLDTVLLVAPTTSAARRQKIAELCSGFVYYLSISGVTGARDALPADLARNVTELKSMTRVPVCVGFGISHSSHLSQLCGVADGAIVGSALVKQMEPAGASSPEAVAQAVRSYCRQLLSGLR